MKNVLKIKKNLKQDLNKIESKNTNKIESEAE